jgi:hypothetical protein
VIDGVALGVTVGTVALGSQQRPWVAGLLVTFTVTIAVSVSAVGLCRDGERGLWPGPGSEAGRSSSTGGCWPEPSGWDRRSERRMRSQQGGDAG